MYNVILELYSSCLSADCGSISFTLAEPPNSKFMTAKNPLFFLSHYFTDFQMPFCFYRYVSFVLILPVSLTNPTYSPFSQTLPTFWVIDTFIEDVVSVCGVFTHIHMPGWRVLNVMRKTCGLQSLLCIYLSHLITIVSLVPLVWPISRLPHVLA